MFRHYVPAYGSTTSEDATAYATQRNGGSRKYHWWTQKQQKLLAVFGWLSCIRDATLLASHREIMLLQECCETGFSRLNLIMTKMRKNLLVVTLDALMMLFINDPSLEPDVPSPTIELSEMCKLGYLHWTKAKNRNSKRCHQVSRARAHEVTAEQCVSRCARVQAFSAWRLRG